MSGFGLHPQAYADLDEIWEYIAADSLDAADRTRNASAATWTSSFQCAGSD